MAYTYTGTPNQRIEQAKRRISNEESVAISPTLSAYMQAAEEQKVQEAQNVKSDASVGERIGDTLGDVAKNTLDGMLKAGEGLLDFGASTIGVIAGWFGNDDLKQDAANWASRDLVGEMWEEGRKNGLDVDFENSFINDMSETGQNIVRGVAQGVGQMLPMVAVTALTAGAGGAAAAAGKISATAAKGIAKAGQVANLVGLGMSAAGTSTEQALNYEFVDEDGNVRRTSLDKAYLYGLASGGVEMATEKLVGGVFEKFTGSGIADKLINKLAKSAKFSKAVQFGLNVVGEGVEEMVSEAVGNTLETIYTSSDGKMHWEDPNIEDVFISGVVGSLTAAVMGGAEVGVRKMSNVQTAQDAYLDYENTQKKADNLSRQGKLDEKALAQMDADANKSLDTISKRYQRASEKGREKMLKSIPALEKLLNEDGTVRKVTLDEGATEITAMQAKDAMSGSLALTRRNEVANKLNALGKALNQNLTLAQNMDETQSKNMKLLEKALNLTGKKSGVPAKVVVVEHIGSSNALFAGGDIVYISKDRLSDANNTARAFMHESTHFAENTPEYERWKKLVDGIALKDGKTLYDTALDLVRRLEYNIDENAWEKEKNGGTLTQAEKDSNDLFKSEIYAHATEMLLGSEEIVNRLVNEDRSLARKVLTKIKDAAKIIEETFKGNDEAVQTLKLMREAEKHFADALAASGTGYYHGKENARKAAQKQESKRNEFNTLAMQWAFSDKTEIGEQTVRFRGDKAVLIERTKDGYIEVKSQTQKQYNNLWDEAYEHNDQIRNNSVYESIASYESEEGNGSFHSGGDGRQSGESGRDGRVYQEQSGRNGNAIAQESAGNQSEIKESRRGYAGRNPADVTEQEYNHHYWAVANDVLSTKESGALRSAVGEINQGAYYPQTADGKYMVAVGENGVLNKIVFTDGGQEAYSVEKVIEIDFDNETDLDYTRSDIYHAESIGIRAENSDLFKVHYGSNYAFDDFQRTRARNSRNNLIEQDGRRSGAEAENRTGNEVKHSLRENATDSEGRTLSPKQIEYFKDTKVVDKNGNLLVMYHGTNSEFNVFDLTQSGKNFGETSQGFFFFTNYKDSYPDSAIDYANEASKKGGTPNVKAVYLDIKKPLRLTSDGYYNTVSYFDRNADNISDQYMSGDYDGVIIENTDKTRDDSILCAVDNPSKIKRIDNLNPTADSDIRYSRRSFDEQVDAVLNGADTVSTHLKVRDDTPKLLVDIGLDNKPILMTAKHTKSAVGVEGVKGNVHHLSKETLKKLPELLENPAIVMDSTKEGSIVMFVNAVDEDNNPVLCAVKVDGDGYYNDVIIDANVVTSIYGKDTNPVGFISKAVDDGRLLYWDKKMNQTLLSIPGLQLPDNITKFDSNTIIRKISRKSTGDDKIKHSLRDVDGEKVVVVDTDQSLFEGVEKEKLGKVVQNYMRDRYRGKVIEGTTFTKTSELEYTHSRDTQRLYNKQNGAYEAKMRVSAELNNLLKTCEFIGHEEAKHPKVINEGGFNRYSAKFILENKYFTGELLIAIDKKGVGTFYDMIKIKEGNSVNISPNAEGRPNTFTNSILQNSEKSTSDDKIKHSKRLNPAKGVEDIVKMHLDGRQFIHDGWEYYMSVPKAQALLADAESKQYVNQMMHMANDSSEPNRTKFADEFAWHILDRVLVYEGDVEMLSMYKEWADHIKQYRKSLDLTSIMKELESKYGKKEANTIRLVWGAPKNAHASHIDSVVMELREYGVPIDSDVMADAFVEMLEIVDRAKKGPAQGNLSEFFTEDELAYYQDTIREDIISFMDENASQKDADAYYKKITQEADRILEDAKERAEQIIEKTELEAQLKTAQIEKANEAHIRELDRQYQEVITQIQQQAANDVEYNKQVLKLEKTNFDNAMSLKKTLNPTNASEHPSISTFGKPLNEFLNAIIHGQNLGKAGARDGVVGFKDFYNLKNQLLTEGLDENEIDQKMKDPNVTHVGLIDKEVLEAIKFIDERHEREITRGKDKGTKVTNNRNLSLDELKALHVIIGGIKHLVNNYDSVYVGDRRLVLSEQTKLNVEKADAMSGHVQKKAKVLDNMAGTVRLIITPDAILPEMFGYQDNSVVTAYRAIQAGEVRARKAEIELNKRFVEFLKEHKSYEKSLTKDKVTVAGHTIPKRVLISLYMHTLQPDSLGALLNSGWGYRNEKGYWTDCGMLTEADIAEIKNLLDEVDLDFVKVLRGYFNATRDMMIETDKQYRGYSMLELNPVDNYFPIVRYSGDMAKSVAESYSGANGVSVANYSFTKERVKNQRRIDVLPIDRVIQEHSRGVSNYYGLAVPIREFQRLYNCNIGVDGKTVTLRNVINEKSWKGFHEYITKLLLDIQGVERTENTKAGKVFGFLRSNYAKFQLGFNLKTYLSQISGYPIAFTYISAESLIKAFTHTTWYKSANADNMDRFSPWAYVKKYDAGIVHAETLTGKLGKIGDFATKPIQSMDNFLNRLLWNACQCEIERTTGLKFGTEENMIKAGELHAEIGRKTQGNSMPSELSAMQRSNSEVVKGLAMFNSDGFKMISRIYEGVGRLSAYRYLNKKNPGSVSQAKMKSAKTYLAKATTGVILSNLVYVLVGQLFKFALAKDRKDDEGNEIGILEDIGLDFLSTMVGMVPIARDLYSIVVEGYEVDNYALEGFTAIAEAIKGCGEGISLLASGEPYDSSDIAKPLKSLVDALGLVTGIPTRNVYNYLYGFTKRFSPAAAYKWNSVFYQNGYTKDLKKAIENDDVDLQKTIVGLMLKDDGLTDTSEKVNEKLRELYKQGYTVLPKSVKDSLNYGGETYNLSRRQQNAFKKIYGQANEDVEKLISNRSFSSMSSEVQAKSIKWIYDYYYESAVFATVGEEADSKKQLFGETMDISKFAMTIAACSAIESKLDKKGNVVPGSKKQAILQLLKSLRLTNNEILMILAYLGYSVSDDEKIVKNYIARIGLTKSQQKALIQYCGLTA